MNASKRTRLPFVIAVTRLGLERNANGVLIRNNDNWENTQQAEIEATLVPTKNDLESASVATIAPGRYTDIVAGKNGHGDRVGRSVVFRNRAHGSCANVLTLGVDLNGRCSFRSCLTRQFWDRDRTDWTQERRSVRT